MPRHPYDRPDYGRHPYDRDFPRHSFGERGYEMGPGWGWGPGGDPNYADGEYHGLRMEGDGRHHAPYGRYRFFHQYDLGGSNGFEGRQDLQEGWYDYNGYYHEQWEPGGRAPRPRLVGQPPRDDYPRMNQDGVRYDRDYLRQYNAYSPALRGGGPRRSWGFSEGPDAPPMRDVDARGRRTDERGHAGYNTGGFAEGKYAGPGTRQSIPTRKGGR